MSLPNPFNPVTSIAYELPQSAIFNLTGQLVETLVNEHKNAAYYSVEWDASRVGSGVYIYRIEAGEYTETKKCVILKL
ncbi:MAG: T9SS type A sorting domain-containing protein [Candidatus Marinimicrobia bacterium]|nr:T9SS type A sorting domain-containing protein [Candidatus Neomarinimicrobiota bacterium]